MIKHFCDRCNGECVEHFDYEVKKQNGKLVVDYELCAECHEKAMKLYYGEEMVNNAES